MLIASSPLFAPLFATALWVSASVVLHIGLVFLVIKERRRSGIGLSDGGDPRLLQAIRAHGNTSEQAPYFLALLIMLYLAGAPALLIHGFGALFIASRVFHAQGLMQSSKLSAGRSFGTLGTWIAYVIGVGGLMISLLMR
jgi:uncharacterized protein